MLAQAINEINFKDLHSAKSMRDVSSNPKTFALIDALNEAIYRKAELGGTSLEWELQRYREDQFEQCNDHSKLSDVANVITRLRQKGYTVYVVPEQRDTGELCSVLKVEW